MRVQVELRILKKSFCCKCGKKLNRKIIFINNSNTYRTFGLKFLKERTRSYWLILPVYYCKQCDYMIECSNQRKIEIKQKEEKSYILSKSKYLIKKFKVSDYY